MPESLVVTEAAPTEVSLQPEPRVVSQQGDVFQIYALDGRLIETRSASGLGYARPNTAQVVGSSIYYVDSAGSSLGGVVRRVTAEESSTLDFTAADEMASLTFAVSPDERRIAWTHSSAGTAGVSSQLFVANMDGSELQAVVQSDPDDGLEEYFALEAVRWTDSGDVIYAWQVTGIGGYILFFGWSSFYLYSPSAGVSTPLVPVSSEAAGPCWYTLSPDQVYAVGGCASDGMAERELASGTDTVFPPMPDQGQEGAAAYSPSGARLAYAVARGEYENEAGQVVVRPNRGDNPEAVASHAPGYFEAIQWVDENRMVVGTTDGEESAVELLGVDGSRHRVGDGRLIGLMPELTPTAPAATDLEGLPGQVGRQELTVVDITAKGDIAGPGIDVVVRNPGTTDIETSIPCGYVFAPENAADQRLMVVQPVSGVVPAGGEATLTAFVICVDPDSAAPSTGAGYSLGTMESGDLLRLAQCACAEDLGDDPFTGIGLMMAGWSIRNDQSFSNMLDEEATGAMSQFFGEDAGEDLSGLLDSFAAPSQEWFDRCGIQSP